MEPTVLKDHRDHTLTLTLNRPDKLNCINWEMMKELNQAVAFAEETTALRFLVIRGAGDRAFSTGGDLKEWSALNSEETARWIRMGQKIFSRIESLPTLSMAVVDGYAYGGGLELALACDLRVATPSASFACPEIQHGWPPGWGGLTRLGRLIGESSAKRLIFLGESIDAEEALRILAAKTGAFEVVVTDDPRLLLGDALPRYDALVMNNIHERDPFLPADFARLDPEQKAAAKKMDAAIKQSILDFVKGVTQRNGKVIPGKGIVGIHAATCALQGWPEYGEMINGYFSGHPWNQEVRSKIEEMLEEAPRTTRVEEDSQ